jgi:hypothetical protein
LQFESGTSTMTLLYVSGGAFQADWLEFTSVTAVDAATWGAMKRLFR